MEKLKPCPKCGSDVIFIDSVMAKGWLFCIRCLACNYTSGFFKKTTDAVDSWNRRVDDGET